VGGFDVSYESDRRRADRLNREFLRKIKKEEEKREKRKYKGSLDVFGIEFDEGKKVNKGKITTWKWGD
jgi:hypothetical protein